MAGGNENRGAVERRTIGELLRDGQYTWAAEALGAAQEDCARREDAALTFLLNVAVRLCAVCGQLHGEAERHLRAYQETTQRERELQQQLDTILDLAGTQTASQRLVEQKVSLPRFKGSRYLGDHSLFRPAERGGLWRRIRRLIGWQPLWSLSRHKAPLLSTPAPASGAPEALYSAPLQPSPLHIPGSGQHAGAEAAGAQKEGAVSPIIGEGAAAAILLGPGPEGTPPPASPVPEVAEMPDAAPACDPVPADAAAGPGQRPSPDEAPCIPGPAPEKAARSLEVYCLGTFRVYADGQLVEGWAGHKCKSVLKYLVTHREQPIHIEVLMDLFWRDAEPESARRNLYQAVYHLRRALQDGDPDFSYILSGDECYTLHPEVAVWVDSEALIAHYRGGQRLEREGRIEEAILEYEAADNLYEGEFLAQDRYEEWPLVQRENLRHAHMEILDRLSRHYLDRAAFGACIAFCQKILAEDRCREDAHRRLMRCYLRQGQRNRALHQYHLCEEALRQELDVEPMPATTALYRQIQGGEVQFQESGELSEK